MSDATSVDLPAPGGPVMPDEVRGACPRVEVAHRVLGELGVVLDGGQEPRQGPSVTGPGGVGERARPLARGGRHRGGQSSVRAFARM